MGICARIYFESAFYPYKRDLTEIEQAETARLFIHLEELLADSYGPYLFGLLRLTDLMLAPTAILLSRHNANIRRFPHTASWIGTILQNDLVAVWLEEADQLPHIWFDDYLIPGQPMDLHSATA
ncbi:hypothetical protein [Microvirga arabica]|uniref:hypothetical protein n=1 Tax=Microvirga arabica TaxID=1128671 RepID=UPI00193A9F60|nr:hypothetical protein [Microvirga arabica]MBM1173445.1 hypothetical protein [Microvirga arabica]